MQIATKRFLLRDFEAQDRPPFLAYHADPRYLALYPNTAADPHRASSLLDTFARWSRERPRRHYQLAAIRRGDPPVLVGCCGLRSTDRAPRTAELGIELAPAFWGRHGVAIEIAGALLAFGFDTLGVEAIVGTTTSANGAVRRLAQWFGAELVASRPGPAWMSARGWMEVDWRIARSAWRQAEARRRRG